MGGALRYEIYHIGYDLYTPDKWDFTPKTKELFLQKTLSVIQNEGMATYVAYKARDIIPSDHMDPDHKLLENQEKVDIAFQQINNLISESQTLSIDSLNKKAWVIGVEKDRAFYVAGAYMAYKLEKENGKGFLVNLVKKDSRVFIEEYNKIAEDKRRIEL